jgi:hypothetical protein
MVEMVSDVAESDAWEDSPIVDLRKRPELR